MGTEFMPPLDEGSIAINVVRLPNASLDGSVKVADFIEKRLLEVPRGRDRGQQDRPGRDLRGPDGARADRRLHHAQAAPGSGGTGRDKAELVEAIQQDLAEIPGLRFSFSQPIALRVNELISGVKSDLAVKVFGPDLEVLKGFADRVAAALMGVEGARDVKVEQVSGMSQLDVVIDREAAARHGIKIGDVNDDHRDRRRRAARRRP